MYELKNVKISLVATSTLVGNRLKHTQNIYNDTQNNYINSECTLKQSIPLPLFLIANQPAQFLKQNKPSTFFFFTLE
jgi:hypothetical protein